MSTRKPVVMPAPESAWVLATNFFLVVLGLITLILVALVLAKNIVDEKASASTGPDFSAASGGGSATLIGSTECDDGNSCTQDFKYTIENTVVCKNEILPTNTSCSHQCLISASGLCVTGKCKGLCNGYCPYYIDWDPSTCPTLTLQPDIQDAVDAVTLFYGQLCYYGKCVYVLDSPVFPAFTCSLSDSLAAPLDYIDNTPQCLAFLDSTDIVSSCFKASTLCVFGAPVCIYQYTCSGYDIFSPAAPPTFGSLSISTHEAKIETDAEISNDVDLESTEEEKPIKNKTKTKSITTKTKDKVKATATKKNIRGKIQDTFKTETLSLPPKKAGHKPASFSTRLSNTEVVKIRQAYMDAVNLRKQVHKSQKRSFDTVALGELNITEATLLVYESLGGSTLGEFIADNVMAMRGEL